MGIPLGSSFDFTSALPLDSREQVADETARDAIPSGARWIGMQVHCVAEEKTYSLVGGITNSDWVEVGSGAGGGAGGVNYMAVNWDLEDTDISMFGVDTLASQIYATAGTDYFGSPGHTLQNGDRVSFRTLGSPIVGTGLSVNTVYYVRDVIPDFFKLSATLGGAVIDVTSTGNSAYMACEKPRYIGNVPDSLSLSIAHSTVGALYGDGDLRVTKSAVNAIGNFVYRDFTIDFSDMRYPKAQQFSCAFGVVSGTYNSGSSTEMSDLIVYFQNITTGEYLEPSGMKVQQGLPIKAVFQNNYSNSGTKQQYRMLIYVATASTSAYVVQFDNFSVGPQVTASGYAGSDWVAYTPVFVNLGTVTVTEAWWKRVGDSVQLKGRITLGTTVGTAASMSLPSGLTVDATKETSTALYGYAMNQAKTNGLTLIAAGGASTVAFGEENLNPLSTALGTAVGASGNVVSWISELIPITGWSSNTVASSETDTRVVDFSGYLASSTALTASTTPVPYTVIKDSHGGWSTNTYTVKVPGDYFVGAGGVNTSGTGSYVAYVNSAAVTRLHAGSTTVYATGSALLPNLKAGDTIQIRNDSGVTLYGDGTASASRVSIYRLSGPAQITESEKVSASYYLSANFAATATIPINFDTKIHDSHGAVTVSATAWRFTAPRAMKIGVKFFGIATTAIGSWVTVYKSGANYRRISYSAAWNTAPNSGECSVVLKAGEYIDIRPLTNMTMLGTALDSGTCTIDITDEGPYV